MWVFFSHEGNHYDKIGFTRYRLQKNVKNTGSLTFKATVNPVTIEGIPTNLVGTISVEEPVG